MGENTTCFSGKKREKAGVSRLKPCVWPRQQEAKERENEPNTTTVEQAAGLRC